MGGGGALQGARSRALSADNGSSRGRRGSAIAREVGDEKRSPGQANECLTRIPHHASVNRSRGPEKRHRPQACTATGPNQVWSWDITYLKPPVRGCFYYLYMTMDVWSRKIVGCEVHATECASLAAQMTAAACAAEGVGDGTLVLHSDNGGPMRGATMLAKLQELGVATSFSRPSVSNDNPFSESAFRTAKYRPEYPVRPFESVEAARAWARSFVRWYNEEHLHSSIRFVTPSDRHEGHERSLLEARERVYEAARQRNPERWSRGTRNWKPVREVTLNPAPDSEVRADE